MGEISQIIIILAIIAALFMAWFFSHKSKVEERRLLIEKGASITDLPESRKFTFPWLKIGIFITTWALGVIITISIIQVFFDRMDEGIIVSILILFAGLGLIASHVLPKKFKSHQKDEN
jgi:hypothetical protein